LISYGGFTISINIFHSNAKKYTLNALHTSLFIVIPCKSEHHHLRAIEILVATTKVVGVGLGELQATDVVEVQQFQHLLGVGVDLDDVLLQSGDGRDVVVATLTLLLLQLDGNTTDLGVAQTAHQMGDIAERVD